MFIKQKQQKQYRKGNNRWADDAEDNNNNNQISNKNNFNNYNNYSHQNNTPSFIKKTSNTNSNYDYNQQRNNNYQQSNTSNIKKDTRFALEKKLIDDILQPTGIKIKPDEKLMVVFCRRAKNLHRTLIYTYIMEKISL